MAAAALVACGRLGYELRAPADDAGSPTAEGSGNVRSSADSGRSGSSGTRSIARIDAGLPRGGAAAIDGGKAGLDAAAPTVPDASGPGKVRGDIANGEACTADDVCKSGACVSGSCCESRCDAPPQCFVAAAASCDDGRCEYQPAPDGTTCDDGSACTMGDRCIAGHCAGSESCDDAKWCTQDFCSAQGCGHASSCAPTDSACSYERHAEHGYWLCPGPVSFHAAQTECERIGATIATINDAAEQDALWRFGMRDTWIGYRTGPNGADAGFDWVAGDSNFEAWAADDLDAGAPERCAFLSAAQRGAWQSRACSDEFSGFACELASYPPPDPSCTYARRDGHGYYFCKLELSWPEADRRCSEVGAYLAELADANEQGFVEQQLTAGVPYAIGVSDLRQEGEFVTSRWARVAFTAWGQGEPSASAPDLDYVVLQSEAGTWRTVGPEARQAFICEQER